MGHSPAKIPSKNLIFAVLPVSIITTNLVAVNLITSEDNSIDAIVALIGLRPITEIDLCNSFSSQVRHG